jgi:molybdenum cofactor cytidylyltransferase
VSDIAAVVLAAGRGTRFGSEPKLLAQLNGKPLVRHVAEAAVGASVWPVIVVTGHRAEDVEAVLSDLQVQAVHNPLFAEGLSTSLKRGFSALPPDARAAIVLLADMPLITSSLIDALAGAWRAGNGPAALIPTVDGRRGNPVVLSRELEASIMSLSGDAGAGAILRRHSGAVEWPTQDRAVLQDVDTPEALGDISG